MEATAARIRLPTDLRCGEQLRTESWMPSFAGVDPALLDLLMQFSILLMRRHQAWCFRLTHVYAHPGLNSGKRLTNAG